MITGTRPRAITGARHRGRDLLALFQARGTDYSREDQVSQAYLNTGITETQKTTLDADNTAWRMELLEFFRLGDHRLSAGGAYESATTETDYAFDVSYSQQNFYGFSQKITLPDHDEEEYRLYVGDIWPVTDQLTMDAGLQWAKMEEVELNDDGTYEDRDGVLPHLGMVFRLTPKDSLRAAVFKALQPDYLSGGIQQSEVAGFSTVTGVMPGTETTFFGLGYDRQWDQRTFTRLEGRYFERDFPYAFSALPEGESWTEEKIKMIRLVAERLITDMWAASVEYKYLNHEAQDPDRGAHRPLPGNPAHIRPPHRPAGPGSLVAGEPGRIRRLRRPPGRLLCHRLGLRRAKPAG